MNKFRVQTEHQGTLIGLHVVIVSLIMAMMVYGIVQLGEYLSDGWNGYYLVGLALVISLEAQYTQRKTKNFGGFTRNTILFRISEWVVLLLVLKLMIYAMQGFSSLVSDVGLWREDFLMNFFSGEYLLVAIVCVLVWGFSTFFTVLLVQMEGDEELLKIEHESRLSIHRVEVRNSLAITVLVIGVFLAGMVSVIYFGRQSGLRGSSGDPLLIFHLIFFFVFSLILLSLTQFSILRVRWILEDVPYRSNMARSWILYSLSLLVVIGVVALILPTNYTIGLLDFLNILLTAVLWILWIISVIVILPLAYLINLIFRLLGKSQGEQPPVDIQLPKPPKVENAPGSVAEWVQSLLFWSIFGMIIIFSLVYFLRQNQDLMITLRKFRMVKGLRGLIAWLGLFFKSVGHKMNEVVQIQIRKFQQARLREMPKDWNFISLRRLTPRQKVLFYYLAMVRRGGETGNPRNPDQTPSEYSQEISQKYQDVEHEIEYLTNDFIEARYSQHPVGPDKTSQVENYWDRIKHAFRSSVNRKDKNG